MESMDNSDSQNNNKVERFIPPTDIVSAGCCTVTHYSGGWGNAVINKYTMLKVVGEPRGCTYAQ